MNQPYGSIIAAELNGIKNSLDEVATVLKLILQAMEKANAEKESK
jgi:hypothetical protein